MHSLGSWSLTSDPVRSELGTQSALSFCPFPSWFDHCPVPFFSYPLYSTCRHTHTHTYPHAHTHIYERWQGLGTYKCSLCPLDLEDLRQGPIFYFFDFIFLHCFLLGLSHFVLCICPLALEQTLLPFRAWCTGHIPRCQMGCISRPPADITPPVPSTSTSVTRGQCTPREKAL